MPRFTPTAAGRDAKRAKLAALRKALAETTEQQREEIAARLGIVTIEGHALSIINQVLISIQRDNVKIIGGFKQWKAAGRRVKKGEHGFYIWVPAGNRETTRETPTDETDPRRFFAVSMFDISQTEEIGAASSSSADTYEPEIDNFYNEVERDNQPEPAQPAREVIRSTPKASSASTLFEQLF